MVTFLLVENGQHFQSTVKTHFFHRTGSHWIPKWLQRTYKYSHFRFFPFPICIQFRFGWIQILFLLEAFIAVISASFWAFMLILRATDGYLPASRN